jgi:hypothetical protein
LDENARAFVDRLEREVERLTALQRDLDETALEIERADELLEEAIAVVDQFQSEPPERFLAAMRVLLEMMRLDERREERRDKIKYLLSRLGPAAQ